MSKPVASEEADVRHIAKQVEKYWARRGYPSVKAVVEKAVSPAGEPTYSVRSNLVNGLPPDFKGF